MTARGSVPPAVIGRFGEPVTIRTEHRSRDHYGNVTTTSSDAASTGLFEPEQQQPRTDARSPGVVSPARWYLPPATPVSEDDVIVDGRGRQWVATSVQEWPNGVVVAVKRWGTS